MKSVSPMSLLHLNMRDELVEGDAGKEVRKASKGAAGVYSVTLGGKRLTKKVSNGADITGSGRHGDITCRRVRYTYRTGIRYCRRIIPSPLYLIETIEKLTVTGNRKQMETLYQLSAAIIRIVLCSFSDASGQAYPYKNASLPINERVEDLLRRMTLEEKIAQIRHLHSWNIFDGQVLDEKKLSAFAGNIGWGFVEGFPLTGRIAARICVLSSSI